MKINISSIKNTLGAVLPVDDFYKFDDLTISGQRVEFHEPAHLRLQITNSGDEYLVTGKLTVKPLVECSRCVEKFFYPMDIDFCETYPKEQVESENFIDLTDAIHEHIILEMPMKTVCDENCKGLCPQCGQNLNLGECGCNREIIDPRLLKLKDFFRKD